MQFVLEIGDSFFRFSAKKPYDYCNRTVTTERILFDNDFVSAWTEIGGIELHIEGISSLQCMSDIVVARREKRFSFQGEKGEFCR